MLFNVLVAEPSDNAWIWIAKGIRRHFANSSIMRVKDGDQALRFLFHTGLLSEEPFTPNLIVLAAQLKVVTASDVLTTLRHHPRTRSIPVIVRWRDRDWSKLDLLDAFATQDPLWIVGSDGIRCSDPEAELALCGAERRVAQEEYVPRA